MVADHAEQARTAYTELMHPWDQSQVDDVFRWLAEHGYSVAKLQPFRMPEAFYLDMFTDQQDEIADWPDLYQIEVLP